MTDSTNPKTVRRILGFAAKLAITVAVLVFIVWKLGWSQIAATAQQAQLDWLLLALAVFLVSGWLGVIQWMIILRNRGVPISFYRAFSLYFIGLFFNNFALGIVTGDAVKVAYLKMNDRNNTGKPGFAATFLDRFAGLWAMMAFAVLGSALLIKQKALESRSMTLAVIALFVTFFAFGGILAFLLSKNLQNKAFKVIDRLPIPKKQSLKKIIQETLIESHDMHIILPVAILTTVVQLMRIFVHICVAASLFLLTPDNFHYFFIFVPMLAMLMILPLPFGVRESVGGALFALAGFQMQAAIIMGFLASMVGIAGSLLGGVLFLTEKGRKIKDKK
jgi:glycosyltransferase 2 family protein